MLFRHEVGRLEHHRPQFFHRHALRLVAGPGFEPGHEKQRTDEEVDEPHNRIERLEQGLEHVGDGQRDALGVRRTDDLWRDLGKNKNEKGHCERADAERKFVFAENPHRDHAGQHRRGRVDEVVAEQDHTE